VAKENGAEAASDVKELVVVSVNHVRALGVLANHWVDRVLHDWVEASDVAIVGHSNLPACLDDPLRLHVLLNVRPLVL